MPYRDSDSESEPEQQRSVSDFDLLSGSDEEESTAFDALAFCYVRGRGRGHAVVWDGRIEDDSSKDDDMPYNWASGRGRGRGRGRSHGRAAPSVGATADLPRRARAKDAREPLGHPSLGSNPYRKGSKSQNKLLKWFLTKLLENCFLADTQQMPP